MNYDEIDNIVYSEHVQPILNNSCAAAACHNSADRAFDFSTESYADLEAGSRFGSMIVPFEPERSHFYLHVTGDIEPRMPLGLDPLSDPIVRFLERWIAQGARDDDGSVMYSGATSKAFIACQGENSVAVVDTETGHLIRLIPVDAPHSVHVDRAGHRLFVSRFQTAPDNIHVYDTRTYELLYTGRAGTFPALMEMTPDGSQLWVTNFDGGGPSADHAVRVLDPDTLAEIEFFEFGTAVQQPHGLAMNEAGTLVYVSNIISDNVWGFFTGVGLGVAPNVDLFPVDLPDLPGLNHRPQQCVLSADENHLFVSTLETNRIYALDLAAAGGPNPWVGEVIVPTGPWHIALSKDWMGGHELWVANWLDSSVSIVAVSDPTAMTVVGAPLRPTHPADDELAVLLRPIGIAFSPDGTQVYVSCANDDDQSSGHHPAPDGEKNPGSVVVFDAATRTVVAVAEVPNFARFASFQP
ncbi:MAG: hypothetical protein DHS20C21_18240 [Gemmatimonadota bacterium]|nr:MAG: hypothetical protein DHS20C21_18240 [Gemmatimonadota bacterium]